MAGGLDRPAGLRTLGQLYLAARYYEAASQWLDRASRSLPPSAELLDQRAWALLGQGKIEEAQQEIAKALADLSLSPEALNPLAMALRGNDPSSLAVIADTLFDAGQFEPACQYYQRLAEAAPSARVYGRLGHIFRIRGALSQAVEYSRRAMAIEPDSAECLSYAGSLCILLGRIDEGVAMIRQAAERQPDNAVIGSSVLFTAHYLPDQNRHDLFEEHRRWGQRHAPVSLARRSHDNEPDPDRPLRVGFLCTNFRMHSVSYNFEALLDKVDHRNLQLFGYGSVDTPDHVTARLAAKFDVYRSIFGLDDKTSAELILKDRIDILAVLEGHAGGHRVAVLAYKPAPIQVDYQSIDTSGLAQVDYRVTDEVLDPPGSQRYYVERLVYLPGGVVCYRPPELRRQWGPCPRCATDS